MVDDKQYYNSTCSLENERDSSMDEDVEEEHVTTIISRSSNEVPKIGMMLSNEDDAYKFYNEYAKEVGFSVQKINIKEFQMEPSKKDILYVQNVVFRKTIDPLHMKKINRL